MSFSRDTFTKKLASLQDTQESIVSISQWVFFHNRHSKECAKIWCDYALNVPANSPSPSASSAKILSLLHLCNDVVQRARRKKKLEFINEFGQVLPVVLVNCYAALDSSIKSKIDRLISVWSERFVFSPAEIKKLTDAIEVSKTGSSAASKAATPPAPLNSIAIAPELSHLNDLYMNLNKLNDISQSNLTQFGIQSKTYLPHHPTGSENLPAPKIYISKLNMLEKLGKISLINIKEIQNVKGQVVKQLNALIKLVDEPSNTDGTKMQIINDKLTKLQSTRDELREILQEEKENDSASSNNNKIISNISNTHTSSKTADDEEPSPAYDDSDDDLVPTYEEDEDDDIKTEEDSRKSPILNSPVIGSPGPSPISRKRSQTPSGGSTPSSKRVAFSEDIEVKEFDKEDGSDVMSVAYTNEHKDNDSDSSNEITSDNTSIGTPHSGHLELPIPFQADSEDEYAVHRQASSEDEDDGYDPASGFSADSTETSAPNSSIDVMSLLDRLG